MISPQVWREILKIFFTVRRSVENVFAGEYRSAFKGEGLEFEEVREYSPGDDIRNIDWKVTARTGRPFIKKYIEERELTLIILLDLSASLNFGSRKSKSQILKLIREVLAYKAEGKRTDIKAALEYLYRTIKKRAIIFVVSDFYADDYEKPLKIVSKKHDVIPIVITDPLENDLDIKGDIFLEDEETGDIIFMSPSKRKQSREILGELIRRRDTVLKNAAIDYVELKSDRSYLKDLFLFFQRRFRKR